MALLRGLDLRRATDSQRSQPLLFAEYPELSRTIPWIPLVQGPTPVELCTAITPYLGRSDVWMKRDDRISPIYGGNKIRRFEFLFADAREKGRRTLLTVGGLASTQVLATVLLGRAMGFDVQATLFEQPVTSFARRAMLTGLSGGGTLVHGGGYVSTAYRAWKAYRGAEDPYFIFPGASSPLAILGYVDAMLELGEQVRLGEMPRPDYIVVAAGSGGTLAGLAIGAALLDWPTIPVGVRITDLIACNRPVIRFRIRETIRYLARHARAFPDKRAARAQFLLDHSAAGKGYGYLTKEGVEAIPEIERLIGVPGEVTYSGKAVAALRRFCSKHPGKTILFWNTLSSAELQPPAVGPEGLGVGFARYFAGSVDV
jgi:1-aminocyclopropane-1-carboxylate deaminase/D-cysteine desulfhydrase-like pyridoxal-dependent ACC family enzyme